MFLALFYISTCISAIIAGVSFYRFSKRDTGIKLIGLIFLTSFLFNCGQYLAFVLKIPLVNQIATTYVFSTFLTYTWWYDLVLGRSFRRTLIVTSSMGFIWSLIVVLFIQNSGENTTYVSLTAVFLWLLYSIMFFYKLMRELPTIHLHRLPSFWFNSSFLMYSSGTIVIFASFDYLSRVNADFWAFYICPFILSQLVIVIGLYYDLKGESSRHVTGPIR